MFRIGGVAEGITSGLQPRQGYATNKENLVRPNDPSKYKFRDTGVSDFLINWGLDLASRPAAGNIFQQAATSAKEPFKQFQTARAAGEEREWKMGLHREKMDWEREKFDEQKRQFDKELEQERYLGELEAQGERQFMEKQIDNYWDPLIAAAPPGEREKLQKEKAAEKYKIIVQGFDVSDQYKILSNEAAWMQAQSFAEAEIANTPNPKTGTTWTEADPGYSEKLQELINKYLKLSAQFLEEDEREPNAIGGRVGYQAGKTVMPAPGPTDQGETNQINISYEQLRERLPPEISNDIVLLLSQSYEAFADFAEIQTQADVNEFNTKYNVQLFLPKQAGA